MPKESIPTCPLLEQSIMSWYDHPYTDIDSFKPSIRSLYQTITKHRTNMTHIVMQQTPSIPPPSKFAPKSQLSAFRPLPSLLISNPITHHQFLSHITSSLLLITNTRHRYHTSNNKKQGGHWSQHHVPHRRDPPFFNYSFHSHFGKPSSHTDAELRDPRNQGGPFYNTNGSNLRSPYPTQ